MKAVLAIVLVLAVSTITWAQAPDASVKGSGKLSGVVLDAKTKAPVSYATIALIEPSSGKTLDGTLADENGKFAMDKVSAKVYNIQISFIGYETRTLNNINISDKKNDLGKIMLNEQVENLKEVTVEGQRAMIEEKVDRTVYNAENDISNKGGDATDVLRKVPMLSVDLDGNVSLRGSQNIKVLINNRPSTITAGSIADALKQIPADMIKSVEVITSPSAKYDAEGSAGIINIVTKKNTLQGGSLNLDTSAGIRGSNLGLNGSYRTGKLGLSLGGHGRANYNMPGSFVNNQTTFSGNDVNTVIQSADTRRNMMMGRYNFGWDYDINEKNFINGSVQYGVSNNHAYQDQLTSKVYSNDTLQSITNRDVVTTDNSGTVDVNFNYTHNFSKPQQELNLLTQYSRNNRTNNFTNSIFSPESQMIDSRLKNVNKSFNQESTIQLDYQTPVKENQLFEIGAKQIMRVVTSDYATFRSQGNNPFVSIGDASLSNKFNYLQNISASYLSYTYTTPSKYSFKGGARYEYTSIRATFRNSDEPVTIAPYGVLVPSINISKTLKAGNSVKFSYNRRIQRPSLQFLNPNVQNSNPVQRTVGNPALRPEFTNNLELSYNTNFKGTFLTFTGFVRNTNNAIQAVRTPLADSILLTSYYNIGLENAYGLSTFGNINFSVPSFFSLHDGKPHRLTINGGGDIFYADLSNNVADVTQRASNSGFVYNVRMFGNYDLGNGWGMQGFGFYRGRQIQLQGKQGGFGIYSLSFKKDIKEGKGSIGFGAENFITGKIVMKNELQSPNFNQTSTNISHNLNFKVTFSYRIGKLTMDAGPKRRKKSVSNDDLKSEGESSQSATMPATTPQTGNRGGGAPGGMLPAGNASQNPAMQKPVAPAAGTTTTKDSTTTGAGEATGHWQGMMGPFNLELDLTATGNQLTGTMQTPRGQQPISNGKVTGSDISFEVQMGGNAIQYAGKVNGDQLILNVNFQGRVVEGTLQRVK